MTPDWNAIRLDLLGIDEPMRATLREMRPFFAKVLPGILARFYDKVRQYDPTSGIFKDGADAGSHPPAAAALGPDRRRPISAFPISVRSPAFANSTSAPASRRNGMSAAA